MNLNGTFSFDSFISCVDFFVFFLSDPPSFGGCWSFRSCVCLLDGILSSALVFDGIHSLILFGDLLRHLGRFSLLSIGVEISIHYVDYLRIDPV